MKIQLIDYNREMAAAYKEYFKDVSEVFVANDSAFAIPTECIVSPANSFAFMDGGFDRTITDYLGGAVEANVRKMVRENYNGELLVGQAFYVPTENALVPFCICAPTMRVPSYLGEKTINPYLAARAIFLLLRQENLPFKSVTIPGLGTGVGRVPYDLCAHQVRAAYEHFYRGDYSTPESWQEAMYQHNLLNTKAHEPKRDLQFVNPDKQEDESKPTISRFNGDYPGPINL